MNIKKNIVLVDADSLSFIGKPADTLVQIIEKVDYKIQAILSETDADYYCLFISQGKYFRHALKNSSEESGSYKSNRKYTNQNYNRVIKEYLIAQYGAVSSSLVEADDYIAWMMNQELGYGNIAVNTNECSITFKQFLQVQTDNLLSTYIKVNEPVNLIMAAVDKDLLLSIPGKHLNYNKKLGVDEWGMEWVETSINDASFYEWEAMVTGDQSDGIKGLYRKGKAWIDKNFAGKSLKEVQHLVFDEYMLEYGTEKGIYEFQKNYRLLHLLDCDEDFKREVGYVPELPNFNKVYKENIEIKNEF